MDGTPAGPRLPLLRLESECAIRAIPNTQIYDGFDPCPREGSNPHQVVHGRTCRTREELDHLSVREGAFLIFAQRAGNGIGLPLPNVPARRISPDHPFPVLAQPPEVLVARDRREVVSFVPEVIDEPCRLTSTEGLKKWCHAVGLAPLQQVAKGALVISQGAGFQVTDRGKPCLAMRIDGSALAEGYSCEGLCCGLALRVEDRLALVVAHWGPRESLSVIEDNMVDPLKVPAIGLKVLPHPRQPKGAVVVVTGFALFRDHALQSADHRPLEPVGLGKAVGWQRLLELGLAHGGLKVARHAHDNTPLVAMALQEPVIGAPWAWHSSSLRTHLRTQGVPQEGREINNLLIRKSIPKGKVVLPSAPPFYTHAKLIVIASSAKAR